MQNWNGCAAAIAIVRRHRVTATLLAFVALIRLAKAQARPAIATDRATATDPKTPLV
jgi:hypothetical protein